MKFSLKTLNKEINKIFIFNLGVVLMRDLGSVFHPTFYLFFHLFLKNYFKFKFWKKKQLNFIERIT